MKTKQLLHFLVLSINITLVLLMACLICMITNYTFDHLIVVCNVLLVLLLILFVELILWIRRDDKERDMQHKIFMMKCEEIKKSFTALLFREKILKIYLKSFDWKKEVEEE